MIVPFSRRNAMGEGPRRGDEGLYPRVVPVEKTLIRPAGHLLPRCRREKAMFQIFCGLAAPDTASLASAMIMSVCVTSPISLPVPSVISTPWWRPSISGSIRRSMLSSRA